MSNRRIVECLLLGLVIFIGFFFRMPLTKYNLPVCSNVDERWGLERFYIFKYVSLDPGSVDYPTFYYYLTFFLLKPFAFENILMNARILNLIISCCLVISVFLLSKYIFKSVFPSILSSALTMFSPIIIRNGSYIITDILLATLCVLSLFFFIRFFDSNRFIDWLLGTICAGAAVATKYTAIIAVSAYVITEFIRAHRDKLHRGKANFWLNISRAEISPNLFSILFLCFALIFLSSFIFFPNTLVYKFVESHGRIDSAFDAQDILFINFIRKTLMLTGILSLVLAFLTYQMKNVFKRFRFIRPYLAVIFVAIISFLLSPYLMIHWKEYLYGFGAVLKADSVSVGEQQWIGFFKIFLQNEGFLILFFFLFGVFLCLKQRKQITLIYGYLILSYLAIGSNKQGWPRYLTPILPVIFIIAAWSIYYLAIYLKRYKKKSLSWAFIIIVIALILFELYPEFSLILSKPKHQDELHFSYKYIKKLHPSKILFAGNNIPHTELKMDGFDVRQVPKKYVQSDYFYLIEEFMPNDILIVDGSVNDIMNQSLLINLELLYKNETGVGQYIYKKR